MLQCFVKPKPNQKWVKKGATCQSFIQKEITCYRIGTLVKDFFAILGIWFWKFETLLQKWFHPIVLVLLLVFAWYIIILESLVQWAPNTTPCNNMQPWYLMLCAKSLLFPVAWKISDRSISLQIMIFVMSFLHLFIFSNFAWQKM